MSKIMKLIYANSLFSTVHCEIYEIEKDLPLYLELIHNTDDDSLLLYLIQDPVECKVMEIVLDSVKDENWLILKARYGVSTENIMKNVQTMFRTIEFLHLLYSIRGKPKDTTISKLSNYSSNGGDSPSRLTVMRLPG